MVAGISSNTNGLSNWADSIFSRLDTKNQGYIEKSDLQSALSATDDSNSTQSSDIDDAFSALDGDGDGKVTKSELTDAMTKLSDQLNAQFDAGRMNGGGGARPDGPPPGPPPDGAGAAGSGGDGTSATQGQHDPMRAFAHALHLLKAYGDSGSGSGGDGTSSTGGISVDA